MEEYRDVSFYLHDPYVGRGILVGKTPDGKQAVCAYFIMGRSANSRNRVFTMRDGVLYTEPFDPRFVKDARLILYAALRTVNNRLIVTNGDQTDTICAFLKEGKSAFAALQTRTFEPDAPNFTPRISAVLTFENGDFSYDMSILKSADSAGSACLRQWFCYPSLAGRGHFLHTYAGDGDPLPSFQGEPEHVRIEQDIDRFCDRLWNALNEDNKISLFVRYTDLRSGAVEDRILNKNGK